MIAAAGPSPLWYLTRGSGLVTLLLLSASVVMGVLQVLRWAPAGSPRFIVVALHRAISLLVVVLLLTHVLAAVLDPFAPITLADAVVPFAGAYRPLWLGLGALALDLLVALTVTSLLRRRLGLRAWRAVHWLAYACWPVALVHGWGTGSDARTSWMLALTLACAAAVALAVAWRVARAWPAPARARGFALGIGAAVAAAIGVWLVRGPLADSWARRAGTPKALLASSAGRRDRVVAARPADGAVATLARPFSAALRGTVQRGVNADGTAVVDVRARLIGGARGLLRVRVAGDQADGGGVLMRRSAVRLGPSTAPAAYEGRIVSLRGSSLEALVGSTTGRAVRLRVDLALAGGEVRGAVTGTPVTEPRR